MLVVIEESYKITVWCREILDGLRQEARKKRISLILSTNKDDIGRNSDDSCVMIVGAETDWLNSAALQAKKCGKHPIILSNQSESDRQNGVSRVTEDISGSMSEIMSLFAAKGLDRVALYAHNPDSASDSFKKEAFLRLGGHVEDVFSNCGSLSDCFDEFYEKFKKKGYGGIVCTNDFAAISLIRHLESAGADVEKIDIISYSDTLISKCTSPAVSTVKANFKSFGQLAFMIVDCIAKGNGIRGIHIFCDWEIIHRKTSSPPTCRLPREAASASESSSSFYCDSELIEMLKIETLLSECDETDLSILEAILCGKKTAEIESSCYLTETAVKYRIKKMKDYCGVSSREELRLFLSRYVASLGFIRQ